MTAIARRRKIINGVARALFSLGGLIVVVVIMVMLFYLVQQVLPLFQNARVVERWEIPGTRNATVATILSEYGDLAARITAEGTLYLEKTKTGEVRREWHLVSSPSIVVCRDGKIYAVSGSDLHVYAFTYLRNSQTGMEDDASLREEERIELPSVNVVAIASHRDDSTTTIAVAQRDGIYVISRTTEEDFSGEVSVTEKSFTIDSVSDVIAVALTPDGSLLAASRSGRVDRFSLEGKKISAFQGPAPLTAMAQLIGGRSILLGSGEGSVEVWCLTHTDQGQKFIRIHTFPPLSGPVAGFTVSGRNRSFAAWDTAGHGALYYATTEKKLLDLKISAGEDLVLNSRGDLLAAFGDTFHFIRIVNPYPEVTLASLFGKVWYEGNPEPGYTWQSTGGSNAFEPKFSFIPLIIGTLKGTLYALLFALPLAITGSLFLNQFIHPNLQAIIKPVVEIMAGLPSVIIGFLAGLWLAPILDKILPGLLAGMILVPLFILIFAPLFERWVHGKGRDTYAWEVFLYLPFITALFALSIHFSPLFERIFFHGDFKHFIFTTFGTGYDQRNAIVVGFAMGFAVIPIIFSMAEDALSFVPRSIVAGSLALGLSRWQTATGVVFRSALPGIFSAVMIGLGRAVGETMIVLMATGNTPIMSWLPFNGFRTFSANIAVELPEAPVGGTLYRLLFFSGLLLLLFTLFINTTAEFVRQRMRRKMGS